MNKLQYDIMNTLPNLNADIFYEALDLVSHREYNCSTIKITLAIVKMKGVFMNEY